MLLAFMQLLVVFAVHAVPAPERSDIMSECCELDTDLRSCAADTNDCAGAGAEHGIHCPIYTGCGAIGLTMQPFAHDPTAGKIFHTALFTDYLDPVLRTAGEPPRPV